MKVLAFALVTSYYIAAALAEEPPLRYCPIDCTSEETEIGRWMCLGRHLFAPLDKSKGSLERTRFVEHDCGGVGWGNSIRGLFNAAAMAAVTGRRLIVTHSSFNRAFLPPNESIAHWDYGLSASQGHHNDPMAAYNIRQYFDFEAHGRAPNRFANWVKTIQESPYETDYKKQVLVAGICGGEREMVTTGGCMSRVMPKFVECVNNGNSKYGYISENMLSIPFFQSLFQRPSPILQEALDLIRDRLDLPRLPATSSGAEATSEPVPGAWGLRTPGYYILALHFRNIPIGFEPLSFELNEKRSLEYRKSVLTGFWDQAERAAKTAKKIASCRKQQLLIYFATDDVKNLRPEAQSRLAEFGRVVFGLSEDEVGHMSPQWTKSDLDKVKKVKNAIERKSKALTSTSSQEKIEVEVEVDTHIHGRTTLKIDSHVANVDRTSASTELHGTMAIVEWWILAHSNWLIGHSGTSFSETASGVGLGPLGVMERFDMVHSATHVATNWRRDWEGDGCSVVRAADIQFRDSCPNNST